MSTGEITGTKGRLLCQARGKGNNGGFQQIASQARGTGADGGGPMYLPLSRATVYATPDNPLARCSTSAVLLPLCYVATGNVPSATRSSPESVAFYRALGHRACATAVQHPNSSSDTTALVAGLCVLQGAQTSSSAAHGGNPAGLTSNINITQTARQRLSSSNVKRQSSTRSTIAQ